MRDSVFNSFLTRQWAEALALARGSDGLTLTPVEGRPPTRLVAGFRYKGLAVDRAGRVFEHAHWNVGISFPAVYLRQPVDVAHILTFLPSGVEPWHPNIRPPFVCLHITPGAPLVEILFGLHDLLTWNLYATSDEGLNHAASQWARNQDAKRFPIDPRPLKRRALPLMVEPPGKEARR